MNRRAFIISMSLALWAANAGAQSLADRFPGIPAPDGRGIEAYEAGFQDRAAALYGNADPASRRDIEAMRALLAAPRLAFNTSDDISGNWQVRSGQVSPYAGTLYSWFKATIRPEGKVHILHKATGSQRKFGHLMQDGDAYFYLGRSYYSDETPRAHSYFSGGNGEDDREEKGYLVKLGPGHLLMILEPQGGRGEILELKR